MTVQWGIYNVAGLQTLQACYGRGSLSRGWLITTEVRSHLMQLFLIQLDVAIELSFVVSDKLFFQLQKMSK